VIVRHNATPFNCSRVGSRLPDPDLHKRPYLRYGTQQLWNMDTAYAISNGSLISEIGGGRRSRASLDVLTWFKLLQARSSLRRCAQPHVLRLLFSSWALPGSPSRAHSMVYLPHNKSSPHQILPHPLTPSLISRVDRVDSV